jgi:hypothetical protein
MKHMNLDECIQFVTNTVFTKNKIKQTKETSELIKSCVQTEVNQHKYIMKTLI